LFTNVGSPPSQQFKSCLAGGTGGDVGSDHSSSVHQIATPQKSVTDDSGRQTVLRKNQFNVYIDNNGMLMYKTNFFY